MQNGCFCCFFNLKIFKLLVTTFLRRLRYVMNEPTVVQCTPAVIASFPADNSLMSWDAFHSHGFKDFFNLLLLCL